jgi:flagellar biosynthesis protein FlhG
MERRPATDIVVLDGELPQKTIWPVAGGKGGTGKSTLTANIGVGLALLGYKVILVDGDLGGADLHLFFDQIAPARSLSHFLTREAGSLKDVLLPTPSENLRLICGGNEMVGLANLSFAAKEKLLRHIICLDADYVLLDLGAGTSFNTLDFFTLSNQGIVVCTPEPHARVDAYGFVKNTVYRKLRRTFGKSEEVRRAIDQFARKAGRKSGRISELVGLIGQIDSWAGQEAADLLAEYRPKLLLNRVRHKGQIEEAQRFLFLVREYLSTEMEYIGYVRNDMKILDACERRRPLMIDSPKAPAACDLYRVIMKGLEVPDRLHRFDLKNSRKMADAAKAEARRW